MKKGTIHKLLASAIAACMLLGLLPGVVPTARAAELAEPNDLVEKMNLRGVTATVEFGDSEYGWHYDEETGRIVTDNMMDIDSVAAEMTITFTSSVPFALSFKYGVNSESSDTLTITLDDYTDIADGIGGEDEGEYSSDPEEPLDGYDEEHTLKLVYEKDGSTSEGEDMAWISDIRAISTGDGTPEAPYSITTADGLAEYMESHYSDNVYAILDADIDMAQLDEYAPWTPVTDFSGHFDGNGHVIRNLTIGSADVPYADSEYVGLFGSIADGEIHDLGIEDAKIYVGDYSDEYVGVLAGTLDGYSPVVISNCYATGEISVDSSTSENWVGGMIGRLNDYDCLIANSWTNVAITANGSSAHIGGILGYDCGGVAIVNCASLGDLNGEAEENDVGGLLGTSCDSGTVISNSYAMGNLSVSQESSVDSWEEDPDLYMGALVGNLESGSVEDQNCFWNTDSTQTANEVQLEGVVAYGYTTSQPENSQGKDAAYMAGEDFAEELNTGIESIDYSSSGIEVEFSNWLQWGVKDGKVLPGAGATAGGGEDRPEEPAKRPEEIFPSAEGTEGDPYVISDEATLRAFAASATSIDNYEGKYIKLGSSIELTEGPWTPIGSERHPFKGTFDGGKNTVSGMNIESTGKNNGFFAVVDGGTVMNLNVSGTMTVDHTGSDTSNNGMIAGLIENSTTVNACGATGTMAVTSTSTSCDGGLVGAQAEGCLIANSWTDVDITAGGDRVRIGGILGDDGLTPSQTKSTAIVNCASFGDGSSTSADSGFVGGIAGTNGENLASGAVESIIFNSYSMGNVATAQASSSQSWETVPDLTIGAIVGNPWGIDVAYGCFWNTNSTQTANDKVLDGIVAYGTTASRYIVTPAACEGKTEAEMKSVGFAEQLSAARLKTADADTELDGILEEHDVKLLEWTLQGDKVLPDPHQHVWGEPTFDWGEQDEDGNWTNVTATRECTENSGHTQTVTAQVAVTGSQEATCEADGSITYTATATFEDGDKTETKTVTVEKLGHKWADPTFTWTKTEDGYTAAYERVCENDKAGEHTKKGEASVEKTQVEATCEAAGSVVYTATAEIDGESFTATKEEESGEALGHAWADPTFTWTKTEDGYTVTYERICENDKTGEHTKTGEAAVTMTGDPATCEAGSTVTYTATVEIDEETFTEDKTETLEALGHKWGEPEFTWNEEDWTATAQRVCQNDDSHVEKGEVTVTSERVEPTASKAGSVTYTATAKFGEETFTDKKTVELPATGGTSGGGGGGFGGGGFGSAATPSTNLPVQVPTGEDKPSDGAVSVDVSTAKPGDSVTLTATPEEGFITGSVTVTDADGKTVTVEANGDGTYDFKMPEKGVTVNATFVTPGDLYSDVDDDAWYRGAVAFAVNAGLMNGTGTGKFEPASDTSRGMIATMLHRLSKEPDAGASDFGDILDGAYYTEAVAWAAENEVVLGVGDGNFEPNRAITRQELALVLYRYAKLMDMDTDADVSIDTFADSGDVDSWAKDAMEWVVKTGIIEGNDLNRLNPQAPATRVEAAAILQRLVKLMSK